MLPDWIGAPKSKGCAQHLPFTLQQCICAAAFWAQMSSEALLKASWTCACLARPFTVALWGALMRNNWHVVDALQMRKHSSYE